MCRSNPPVTVVITTFNRAGFLREAISSVLRQSYPDFRLQICDNASTDDTESVVREIQALDNRVVYCRRKSNVGPMQNIKLGFHDAGTEFVAWLMDDDSWHKDHLSDAITRLERDSGAVLYACGTTKTNKFGSTVIYPWFLKDVHSDAVIEPAHNYIALLPHSPFVGSSVVFRRRVLDAIPFSPPDLPTLDWLLWGLIALQGRVIFNPSVRATYRWHEGNETHALLSGRRCAAMNAAARRMLANAALEAGIMKCEHVAEFFNAEPDGLAVCRVALSLCCPGMPGEVRRAATRALVDRPEVTAGPGKLILLRLARLGGGFAFPWFDRVDQIAGRWRPEASYP